MSENYDGIEFKEVDRKKKVRKKKNYLLRFLVFVGILAAVTLFLSSGFFVIEKIEVQGNVYYNDEEVINISGAQTGGNLFWGAGASEIRDRLGEDPYFAEVRVKRRLPDTLVIEVEERRQTAAIVYGDEYIVIDEQGIVLRKSDVDPKVTLLTGLTVSKMKPGEKIEVEESAILSSTLQMLQVMTDGDIYFKKIDVSKTIIRAYIYDTLLVKGTPRQMKDSIENGNLQKVVNNLFKNDTTRGTISLGNGKYMSFSPEF